MNSIFELSKYSAVLKIYVEFEILNKKLEVLFDTIVF